jgi:hypothetical protein
MSQRIVLALWITGFAIGTLTHALTLGRYGWLPYRFVPLPVNLFWTLLALLDPATILLLLWRRRAGVALGLAIMIADVAVNSYAAYGLQLELGPHLQAQTMFLGFVLGSAPLLLRR